MKPQTIAGIDRILEDARNERQMRLRRTAAHGELRYRELSLTDLRALMVAEDSGATRELDRRLG